MKKIILDLCGGTGAWSKPYTEAGYDVRVVTLPEQDVRLYKAPKGVHGVLAAPPCTQFSLARNGHPELERDFIGGLSVVDACLRIIILSKPVWWALENPVGYLSRWLGRPRMSFQPWEYGDPWTKRTALWGFFNCPPKWAPIRPERSLVQSATNGQELQWKRSVTPAGFARAFFEANP